MKAKLAARSKITAMEPARTAGDKKSKAAVAALLSRTLADSYLLQLKTQYYHWNVTGPHFAALHVLFSGQYDAIAAAVDEIAERIRALGYESPGTFREFQSLSTIKEDKALPASWKDMVRNLLEAHESCARQLRDAIPKAQGAGDEVTADLFITRCEAHEKTAWMLRSHLE